MADSVTRVTHQSYGSRLGNSLQGLLWGPLVIVGAIALLVWNEGNAVTAHRSLDEGSKLTMMLPSPPITIDSSYDGKLVHVIGKAETDMELQDAEFGVIPALNTLMLKRQVQMYQWVEDAKSETTKNTGGSTTTTTTYTYRKDWKSQLVSSSGFQEPTGHENPIGMPFQSTTFTSDHITLGAFVLPLEIVSQMTWFTNLPDILTTESIPNEALRNQSHVYLNTGYYIGNNPSLPTIGDTKITYQVVLAQTISLIAQQLGNSFGAYITKAGKPILLMEQGVHSSEEMYQHAQSAATALAWGLRLVGFILLYLGLLLLVQPLTVAADLIPCIGNLVGRVTSCILLPVAFVVSLVVIALSWIAYRPLLAGSFLAAVAGFIWYRLRGRRWQPLDRNPVAEAYVIGEMDEHDLELQQHSSASFKDY